MFLAGSNPDAMNPMQDVGLSEEEQAAAAQYNRNAVVNVNGSFVATSSTYRSRAQAAAQQSQQ